MLENGEGGEHIKYLRYFRRNAGLTQVELARAIGVDETTIRRWEKGKTAPTALDIQKLCEVLHCTETELLNTGGTARTQRFELILDPDDSLKMEVINMGEAASEQKVMTVTPKRIGISFNTLVAGMKKDEAKKLLLATFDEVFDDAWASHLRMRKREA